MFCTNCGKENTGQARFCSSCGATLPATDHATDKQLSGFSALKQSSGFAAPQPSSGFAASQPSSGFAAHRPPNRQAQPQASFQPQQFAMAAPGAGTIALQQPDPWYQSAQNSVPGMKRPIKTDRSLIIYILLNLVTLGLYGHYYTYKIAQDLNEMFAGDNEKTAGLVVYLLLSFFTFGLYSIYWRYKIANRLACNAPRFGLTIVETGTTVLLWDTLGALFLFIGHFVALNIIIKNINQVAVAYNRMNNLRPV